MDRTKKIFVIIIVVVFIIIVSVASYYIFRDDEPQSADNSEDTTTTTMPPPYPPTTDYVADDIPTTYNDADSIPTTYNDADSIPTTTDLDPGPVVPTTYDVSVDNPSTTVDADSQSVPVECPDGYEKKDGPGSLFCYKSCPSDWKGTKSAHHCQHHTIRSTVGADPNKSIPNGCTEGVMRDKLCYKLPSDDWHVTSPGFIGKKCPSAVGNQKIKDSGTTCWYDRGTGRGYKYRCPSTQDKKGIDCYNKPEIGWDWTTPGGLLVGKVCPSVVEGQKIKDSGITCWYDRGVGEPYKLKCPDGQVQRGVECYKQPDNGWDWTTPGGLLVGKVCSSKAGTHKVNDSGTTCWYDRGAGKIPKLACPAGQVKKGVECYKQPDAGWDWTTPGGLLVGRVCPAGSTDSGVTCWYDRGAGRIPDKRPCSYWDPKWRDDGTSCWSDAHVYGKKCCCTIFSKGCCHNCPAGYTDDGCTCSKNDVGIKKTLFQRQTCRADEDLIAGLCYKKPRPGFTCDLTHCKFSKGVKGGTKLGTARQECDTGKTLHAGLCYENPIAGYNCTATICDFSKEIKKGTKLGNVKKTCDDPDRILDDEMCYRKPVTGFNCSATICDFSKSVKPGKRVGMAERYCSDADRVLVDEMCYRKPITGFSCGATICDYSKEVKPQIGKLPDKCPDGRELKGRLCYPKCPEGYNRTGDNIESCTSICPPGFKNIGIGGCEKPKLKLLESGVCPEGYTKKGTQCTKSQ